MEWRLFLVVAAIGLTASALRAITLAVRASPAPKYARPQRTAAAIGLLEEGRFTPWLPAGRRLPRVHRQMIRVRRDAGTYLHVELGTDEQGGRRLAELELGPVDLDGKRVRLIELSLALSADGKLAVRAQERSTGDKVPVASLAGPGGTFVPTEDDPRSPGELKAEEDNNPIDFG